MNWHHEVEEGVCDEPICYILSPNADKGLGCMFILIGIGVMGYLLMLGYALFS